MASVLFDNVTKRYPNGVVAVRDVSLEVADGELVVLVGPSGCGKTTTLRLIAGFERPDSGRILLDGIDMAATPPHKRKVNTVFQSYALFPHLDVFENVAFGLKRRRVARETGSSGSYRALRANSSPRSSSTKSSPIRWASARSF